MDWHTAYHLPSPASHHTTLATPRRTSLHSRIPSPSVCSIGHIMGDLSTSLVIVTTSFLLGTLHCCRSAKSACCDEHSDCFLPFQR